MTGPDAAEWARRAVRAHAAMERTFTIHHGQMRRDGWFHLPWTRAHLWPFIRGVVACADLLGVAPPLRGGAPVEAALAGHEAALERYWDPTGPAPAYASDVPPRWRGTDRYHDDNAWVALALVQLERLAPAGRLGRAVQLWRFAQSGWDHRSGPPHPGGVFWVEQGRGIGRRNHDRNTVSTAPNAQLALHLADLLSDAGALSNDDPEPEPMLAWVQAALGHDDLFWDKIRGDGSIDRATWSYNQGSMIGAHALLHRAALRHDDQASARHHLARGEAIARRSLAALAPQLPDQPAAFHAIWFRNLLLLAHHSRDARLRADILATMSGYGDALWQRRRGDDDLFRLPASHGRVTLLDQSAGVQILALLAWMPERWGLIA